MKVVGVDGCRDGWISCVYRPSEDSISFHFHPTLQTLATEHEDAACIAVDIPIGLAENGPRGCDVEARKALKIRRSSVFPAPARRVLEAFARDDLLYSEANTLAREVSGKGLSRQTYNILPKIAEADDLITPEMQDRVCEIHPELSFMALAGRPMRHTKKSPEGFVERLGLLLDRFPQMEIRSRSDANNVSRFAAPDDVLDAAAASSSAWRVARGEAARLPATPQTDARGLRMEISR